MLETSLQPVTFERPPVNEVALALQFETPLIGVELLGAYAARLKSDFPVQQQLPALPPMAESVGPNTSPQIQFFPPQVFPRTWFISQDQHSLVQLQADRIALNWRRLTAGQPYPRYTYLRETMQHLLDEFVQLLGDNEPSSARINFCEVSYVNEIEVPGTVAGQPHPDLSRVLNFVNPVRGEHFLPPAEDAGFQARWRMSESVLPAGTPVGRLYLSVAPGYRVDRQLPVFAMNLVARIVPPPATAVAQFISLADVGHDWIVRAFADVTTEEIQREWGRIP